ncbi:MAG: hypothetical protein O3B76_01930 [Proteobacteria bacterium]|nr:hypothetical protein [Pseudomonadota bacterium]MDA1023290.1 hypothetical protein [Pseudomonadota bacterium]
MSNASKKTAKPFGPKIFNCAGAPSVTYLAPIEGAVAHLPAGYPLRKADFIRKNEHLIIQASEQSEVLVPRFFSGGGVEVSRHMVLLMSNLSHRVEKALGVLANPAGD